MTRDEHLTNIVWLTRIFPLLLEASDIIEALKIGEKIPATKLAERVAERHGMTGPAFYPVLKLMLDGYPNVKILRGAHGGVEKLAPQTDTDNK